MTPADLFDRLRSSGRPLFDEAARALEGAIPALRDLGRTPQDEAVHAEGSAADHALLALLEAFELADERRLTGDDRLLLTLAAALHDLGKTRTTLRERGDDGRVRVAAPGHPAAGRDLLAYRLADLPLAPNLALDLLALVAHHHGPAAVSRAHEARGFFRLARQADLRLLHLLALANARGRVSPDLERRADDAEFFRMQAEVFGAWNSDPYEEWRAEVGAALADFSPTVREFALARGVLDFEAGLIHTPPEAVARSYSARGGFADLVVTCGPSGSGAEAWAAQALRDRELVSLSGVREDLERRQKTVKVGHVLQEAKARLRAALREKRKVAWLGPNVRASHRALPLGLARDYGALATLAVFRPPLSAVFAPGASEVPASVRAAEVETAEFPDVTEAHRLVYLDGYGREVRRVGFAFGAEL